MFNYMTDTEIDKQEKAYRDPNIQRRMSFENSFSTMSLSLRLFHHSSNRSQPGSAGEFMSATRPPMTFLKYMEARLLW